jgi:hypothetical protein
LAGTGFGGATGCWCVVLQPKLWVGGRRGALVRTTRTVRDFRLLRIVLTEWRCPTARPARNCLGGTGEVERAQNWGGRATSWYCVYDPIASAFRNPNGDGRRASRRCRPSPRRASRWLVHGEEFLFGSSGSAIAQLDFDLAGIGQG